ncbi:MAG: HPr-rel-A system PqqD family peptide chaperone [Phycisphaerales bacterium]|nr:MAG: HPr-rel-A system PqqD family peptide chaperone [Phycisphaerales bacterium]
MVRFLVFTIVALAVGGAWVSGTLLVEHDGGWQATGEGTSFLLRLCESQIFASASCTGVADSRWGSFDFHFGTRRFVVPTSLMGLAYFTSVAIWFTMVGRVPAWSRRTWRLVLLVVFSGLIGSIFFLTIMLLAVDSWCPLCALANGLNAGIVLTVLILRRVSRSRSVRRTSSGLTDPPVVARIQRRLSACAFAACCVACLGMWFYFNAVTEARRQWRKAFGIKQAVAALQRDADFVLREYYAQPTVYIPQRDSNVRALPATGDADRVVIVVFTDYDCAGCACFERRRQRVINEVFGDELSLDIRHLPAAAAEDTDRASEQPTVPDLPVSSASLAAEAARLQGGQRAFDEMHRLLFEHRKDRPNWDYAALARQSGLNADRLLADMESDAVRRAVQSDVALARRLGVTTTPTVFLNGRRVPDLCVDSSVFWRAIAANLNDVPEAPGLPPVTPMFLTGPSDDDWDHGPEEVIMTPDNLSPSSVLNAADLDAAATAAPAGRTPDQDLPAPASASQPDQPPPVPAGERTPTRSKNLIVHELDDEALIYDPETGDTHRLNQTALFIWRRCDGLTDPAQIGEALAETYDVSAADAMNQVRRMIAEFDQLGLTTREE